MTSSNLTQIAARTTVYRPGVGLVDVPADWRDRMNARHKVLVPAAKSAA